MGQLTRNLGLAMMIWRAQGGRCPICSGPLDQLLMLALDDLVAWSVEHVWPRRRFPFGSIGNQLITHKECNNRKGHRPPTGCEQIWLAAVNAQLGFRLTEKPPPPPSLVRYRDKSSGPTALTLAFQRAMGANPR